MATQKSIEDKLEQRAPFLTVQKHKNGFNLAVKKHPFLLTECQEFLGTKISTLSEKDIDNAIDRVIPSKEIIETYRTRLSNCYSTARTALDKAYKINNWHEVGELALELAGLQEQLAVLEQADAYATSD